MKRKVTVIVLCLYAVLSLLPGTALATDESTEREARLYQLILDGIRDKKGLDGESYIDLSSLNISNADGGSDRDLLWTVFDRVFYDHSELYYLREEYCRVNKNTPYVLGIRPAYVDVAKDADAQARFDAAVDTALAQIEGLTDPVEQMLALYNYLIRTTVYNYDVAADRRDDAPKEAWTAYGALVNGDTVCKGYALAWKTLMDRIGIPCLIVCKGDGTHLWNMVQLDGNWYHIDVNSGNNAVPVLRGRCNYTDFLATDEHMLSKYQSWFVPGTAYRDIDHYDTCPTCTDQKFSTNWIFRQDGVFYPMYRDKSGQYYYIRQINSKKAKLYYGSLSGEGKEIAELSIYTRPWENGYRISGGVVWAEDCLYYVDKALELTRYRLSDGESVSLGVVPFTPQATEDQYFDESYDGISLLFDERSGVLSAQSRARKTTLKTWRIAQPKIKFEDVTSRDYFSQPVQWAIENGVVNGTSRTTFSPAQTCSRAQIITFLWRTAGSPEPKTTVAVDDVKSDDYYYKAALWAAENNLFGGAVFLPNDPCTCAMAVEFIWKQKGRPDAGGGKFSDVSSDASYAQAAAWAINNNVTYGTGDALFSRSKAAFFCSKASKRATKSIVDIVANG